MPTQESGKRLEAELRDELMRLGRQLNEMNSRVEEVVKARDTVKAQYDALRTYVEMTFKHSEGTHAGLDEPSPMTAPLTLDRQIPLIVKRAHELLLNCPEGMHYTKILETLKQNGVDVPGQNPAANLLAHISRFPQLFERRSRGVYTARKQDN